jgi:hypothetical protein
MKRKSLAELQQEDNAKTTGVVPVTPQTKQTKTSKNVNPNTKIIIPKSDFIKMSITVEPEIFDAVEDLSRKRRRSGQSYTLSSIVRDALKDYLINQKTIKGVFEN